MTGHGGAGFLSGMKPLILVAYATKKGSTEEVAQSIARRLSEQDLVVDVRAAADVDDLHGYDGAVLGSALYMGRLHEDARTFLRRHRSDLAGLPFAVFAMGPRTLREEDVADSRKQLAAALAKDPTLEPFATAIFGGVLDPSKQRFPFNRMPASDARDWNAIRAWADEVAARFALIDAVA